MKSYQTRQKQSVLAFMEKHFERSYSVEELKKELENDQTPIPQATLYRFVRQCEREGKVRKYATERGFCYQYVLEPERPCFHLVCSRCGKRIVLSCRKAENLIDHIYAEHRFNLHRGTVVFYGTCQECGREEEK